jgi:WS/DGAT/MGAT family acyltransferase
MLRFHHAITDGVGGIDLAEAIFDRARRRSPAASGATVDPSPGATATVAAAPSSALAVADRAGALAQGAYRAVLDPMGCLRTARRTARSVARMIAPTPGPLSPLLVGRGIDRRLLVAEAPLDAFEAAAAEVGGTVNDVFLAAVGGALRRYHEQLGAPVDTLRVTMPISLRAPGDPPGGNHFAPARFVLPVDDPDLVARARLAGAIVRRWRSEPSLRMTDVLAAVLNRLPRAAVVKLFAGMLRSIDVDAVDVPGLRRPAYLAGARVDRLWAFAPPTGAAMSITLLSHGPTACIGLTCDRAAVSEPERLLDCVRSELDVVIATAGSAQLVGASS